MKWKLFYVAKTMFKSTLKPLRFYLLLNFHLQVTNRSVGPLCRGRTVLRFLTNSYHLSTVELVLKGVLCTRLGSKGSLIPGFPRSLTRRRYAMLMGPNRGETAVHGCHCRGGTVAVHMGKVLTIPQSWYVYFSVYFRIATCCCPKTHSEIISFGCLGGRES